MSQLVGCTFGNGLNICVLVCRDYTKSTELIWTKLGGGMGRGPVTNPKFFIIFLNIAQLGHFGLDRGLKILEMLLKQQEVVLSFRKTDV